MMRLVSTTVRIGLLLVLVVIGIAIALFAREWRRVERGDLHVGGVSPQIVEELARRRRNRWLAITFASIGVAASGPYISNDSDLVILAYLVGIGASVALACAAGCHRILTLARDPDAVISASPRDVVVDCEHQRPGHLRTTPEELARIAIRLPKVTVRNG
jgi:hypothetical protein